ncbi:periplasmic binding protein/LacI transcriptional regulator [Deinococcus aerius]|uniref:Periplasmic binding protein/LacI transcriptional regulator n=1 Tax=Deinococcus aerius TaxID=200253 RepID=A0A2I9D183_9DEIO|nr:sugar ABC transporter substrate-binding protein [Deinococcus aerius]GBF04126.1 periplasmic binding protein/LacI transcriptional regulator [Deinococcus aerius]
MRTPSKIVTASLAAATVLGLALAQGNQPVVGLITKTDTNPFFVKMKEGAQQQASKLGARLLTAAGKSDGDNAGQVAAIENMVGAGAKTILITPSDARAIVPAIQKARAQGVQVIALDSPTDPPSAVDALFATNNFQAGVLIGRYAKAMMGSKPLKVATIDLFPGAAVGVLRHNGFLAGLGVKNNGQAITDKLTTQVSGGVVVCSQDGFGDQAKGQTAMENCLQKNPDINLVYTINEPSGYGAYQALKNAGKEKDVMIVSVDGGCNGVRGVQSGVFAATSQQYPLKMAAMGVEAGVQYAKTGKKVKSGYTDTGVTLIAAKAAPGVPSRNVQYGLANCWGK